MQKKHLYDRDISQKTVLQCELQSIITNWCNTHKLNSPSSFRNYKFDINKILPLPEKLYQLIIQYICNVLFEYCVSDFNEADKVKISLSLKQIYTEEFYFGKWKKQFNFEFSLIYLTKIMSAFIKHYFPALKINENLESQFFIIMVKVFIGNEIGTKIYQLTLKKFIEPQKLNKKQKSILPLTKKKESYSTVYKSSSKCINESPTRNPSTIRMNKPRRMNKMAKSSLIRLQFPLPSLQYTLDSFNQDLKKNLYVQPLPVIVQRKLDINQFQKQKLNEDKLVLMQKMKTCENMKGVLLKTNKITSSMETILRINNTNSVCQLNKNTTKVMLTRQHNSNHYSCAANKIKQFRQKKIKNDENEKQNHRIKSHHQMKRPSKMTLDQWKVLAQKIKFYSKNSPLFQRESILEAKSLENRLLIGKKTDNTQQQHQEHNNIKFYKKIKTQYTEPFKYQGLAVDLEQIKEQSIPLKVNFLEELPEIKFKEEKIEIYRKKERKIWQSSKIMKIKMNRNHFEGNCEKRNQVMNYSMFNFQKLS